MFSLGNTFVFIYIAMRSLCNENGYSSSGTTLTNLLSDSACSDLNMKLRMPELLHIK